MHCWITPEQRPAAVGIEGGEVMGRKSWVNVGILAAVIGLTCFSLWPKSDDELLCRTSYPELETIGSTIQVGLSAKCASFLPEGAYLPGPAGEYEITRIEPDCDCGDCVWKVYGRKITEEEAP